MVLEYLKACAIMPWSISVATSQTFHLDNEYTGPYAVLDFLKQVLNDGTGGNGLAGDNFPVNLCYVVMPLFGDFEQELFVTGQSFALATGLGFHVGTGLRRYRQYCSVCM